MLSHEAVNFQGQMGNNAGAVANGCAQVSPPPLPCRRSGNVASRSDTGHLILVSFLAFSSPHRLIVVQSVPHRPARIKGAQDRPDNLSTRTKTHTASRAAAMVTLRRGSQRDRVFT
ncbi:hypothetical protein PMIN02_013098 [Paraphaeosphaeria minitans]|uniref:Uncharacterized protein n=1 Tax=Paraphaeosphaeria minitans TaxID=565426 RepID=A0A9P6GE13_9PLEO|nr:hypothetical protein PMIN01_08370 [Paraphaeosphaeria minitans]